ncbi:MAG: hydroxyacylglutathione hydrolase [Pseudomonadota bacterium]
MADVRLIPCLSDNYAVLVHAGGETILVDAPEAGPINAALAAEGWTLTTVLITHHHPDHVQALPEVRGTAKVYGPKGEAAKIEGLDELVSDGDTLQIGQIKVECYETPGHTAAPISFFMPDEKIAFTADTIFAMGCGRLFEGTAADLWASFQKLRDAMPDDTALYVGHEYTETNARFAAQTMPADSAVADRLQAVQAARAAGEPTIPTTMAAEKATSPFMRADDPAVADALGMAGAAPVDVFAELRRRRDNF